MGEERGICETEPQRERERERSILGCRPQLTKLAIHSCTPALNGHSLDFGALNPFLARPGVVTLSQGLAFIGLCRGDWNGWLPFSLSLFLWKWNKALHLHCLLNDSNKSEMCRQPVSGSPSPSPSPPPLCKSCSGDITLRSFVLGGRKLFFHSERDGEMR